MRRLLALLVLAGAAAPAAAQGARVVLREAVLPSGPVPAWADTTAMERAAPNGGPIYLGAVLLALGEGSVESVTVAPDPYTASPQLTLSLAATEAQSFSEITGARIGEAVAIVYDGRVLTAPTIQGRIPNGRVSITGAYTQEEAEELAAAIRAATGAADGRAAELRELRASLDLTTPEGAAAALVRASEVGDWLTLARAMHPLALRSVRGEAEEVLEVDGERVRYVGSVVLPPAPPRREGEVAEDGAQHEPPGRTIQSVLEREPKGGRLSAYTDEEVATLLFAVTGGVGGGGQGLVPVGSVSAGEDVAYVVFESAETAYFEDEGYSGAVVVSVRRVGDEWRVLLPTTGW